MKDWDIWIIKFLPFKTVSLLLGCLLINVIFQVATPIGDPPVTMEGMPEEITIIAITEESEIFAINVSREEREGIIFVYYYYYNKENIC